MPIKLEWRVTVHREGNLRSMHKPRLMDGVEGKRGSRGCVVKVIDHQMENMGKSKRIKEDGGVRSPM